VEKIAQWIRKYSWFILGIVAILSLFFFWEIRGVRFEDDVTKYVPASDPEVSFYNSLEEKFSGFQKKSMVVALEFDDLFTPENLSLLQNVVEKISGLPSVQSVTALTNMPEIVTTEYGIEVREVVEELPKTQEEAEGLKERLRGNELVWGKMVTQDGKATVLAIAFFNGIDERRAIEEVKKVVAESVPSKVRVTFFGARVIMDEMSKDSQRNMRVLTPIAGLVLLAILYFGFRSVRGVLLPIFVALLAALWTMGIAVSLGRSFTVITAALPVLLLALVTAYGIHFINRYYEERMYSEGPEVAERTLQGVFVPILLSALTTIGGFLSLLTAKIRPVSDFGLYSAVGVLFGMVFATFGLGAFYAVFPSRRASHHFVHHSEGGQGDYLNRFLRFLAGMLSHRKKVVVALLVGVTALLCVGVPSIHVDTTVRVQMGPEHPITRLIEYFKERFGSTDYNYLCVTTESVRNPFVLREMVRISQYLKKYRNFGEPSSLASFILDLNEAMEGWKAIPLEGEKIENLWFFVGDSDYIKGRISQDERETLVEFRASETTSAELKREVREARNFLALRPKKVKLVPLEAQEAQERLAQWIVEDLELFGVSFFDHEAVRHTALQFIRKPWQDFVQPEASFLDEVVEDARLEIEDLGLSADRVQEALASSLQENVPLGRVLEEVLGVSGEDAQYLEGVLSTSLERVAKKEKVLAFRKEVEKLLGRELGKDLDFVFYEVLDEAVYKEAEDGDVTVTYRITGTPIISNHISEMLFSQQAKSMVLAFVIVFGLLLAQLRSLQKASIAMVPILLTVATSFGIMGWFRIPLNVATLMVASIAIGAGIDYTIHFSSRWYKETSSGNSGAHALRVTFVNTGRGILLNAIGVSGGLYVLALSRISMLRIFGSLVATVLLVGVFYTFFALALLLHLEEYLKGNNNERS